MQETETYEDQLSRVQGMASGDATWDLSDNDTAALNALLARLSKLEMVYFYAEPLVKMNLSLSGNLAQQAYGFMKQAVDEAEEI